MDPFDQMLEAPKPAWMRHPTWRWANAMEYALREDPAYLSDPYVNEMGLMYKYLRDTSKHVRALAASYPEAYGAWLIAGNSNRYSAKWQVEAMMIAGASDDYINEKLPMDRCGGADVYGLYRAIFFDVDEFLNKPQCVLHSVYSTALPKNSPLSDCDALWKLLAYELGLEDFELFMQHTIGKPLPDEIQQYMHQFNQSRAMYYSMHQINDLRLMHNEQLSTLLNLARSHFKYDDEMLRDQEEKRVAGCVKQLLGSVEYALLEPTRKQPPVDVVNNFSMTLVEKTAG